MNGFSPSSSNSSVESMSASPKTRGFWAKDPNELAVHEIRRPTFVCVGLRGADGQRHDHCVAALLAVHERVRRPAALATLACPAFPPQHAAGLQDANGAAALRGVERAVVARPAASHPRRRRRRGAHPDEPGGEAPGGGGRDPSRRLCSRRPMPSKFADHLRTKDLEARCQRQIRTPRSRLLPVVWGMVQGMMIGCAAWKS